MLVEFRADLHIHTCLSPCAELTMTPRAIVERALMLGIGIIAITDHNSADNIETAVELGRKKGLAVIPGMEINSSEEVHILGLFRDTASALSMQTTVYENLQPGENDQDVFGMQVIVNGTDEVLGFNRRLLMGATRLSVDRIVDLIHDHDGLAVASHIDREGFGIIGQLGFIPPGLAFDALEISAGTGRTEAIERFGEYRNYAWVSSSDSHTLDNLGSGTTVFLIEGPTFEELRLAFRDEGGRKIQW